MFLSDLQRVLQMSLFSHWKARLFEELESCCLRPSLSAPNYALSNASATPEVLKWRSNGSTIESDVPHNSESYWRAWSPWDVGNLISSCRDTVVAANHWREVSKERDEICFPFCAVVELMNDEGCWWIGDLSEGLQSFCRISWIPRSMRVRRSFAHERGHHRIRFRWGFQF